WQIHSGEAGPHEPACPADEVPERHPARDRQDLHGYAGPAGRREEWAPRCRRVDRTATAAVAALQHRRLACRVKSRLQAARAFSAFAADKEPTRVGATSLRAVTRGQWRAPEVPSTHSVRSHARPTGRAVTGSRRYGSAEARSEGRTTVRAPPRSAEWRTPRAMPDRRRRRTP